MISLISTIATLAVFAFPFSASIAATLPEIQERGKLIVAVKNNLPPLGFTDIGGKLQGLEIDIARRLAQELLGNSEAIIFKFVKNQERLQVVLDKQVDITIAGVTWTQSRARVVNFSRYYYVNGTSIITNQKSLSNLPQLSNKKIGVLENSSTIAVIRYKLPQAQIISLSSYQQAWELLKTNKIDGFAADRILLTGWLQFLPNSQLLPEKLSVEPLAIVIPKGLQYRDLQIKIDEAISNWQKSGWLKDRLNYWGIEP